MRRRLAYLIGVLVIMLALAYVAKPAGHVPPFDANLVRLAESQLEGYCAGQTFWDSQGMGDASAANSCRAERRGTSSSEVNLVEVQPAFCRAIIASGWEGTVNDCLGIMAESKYWPTYDGSITDQWNRARPYPLSAIQGPGAGTSNGSRTGGRQEPSPIRIP